MRFLAADLLLDPPLPICGCAVDHAANAAVIIIETEDRIALEPTRESAERKS